ncbi:hypothetical protein ACH4PU_30770 [Streptomyces sp. NPDC021100]|uniref:hypothetical protein n=1 Tax=Streptomyces sp. NPDC021100 TaxID=3365114 RepID=UPI0037A147C2
MATSEEKREELHELVNGLPPEKLEEAVAALREVLGPVLPRSLGMGHSGRSDLSERADDLLGEDGFGR